MSLLLKIEKKLTGTYTDIHRELVERCKRGNQKAQFELYQHYAKAMFNICMRMMGNREEAEDRLQEAFSEAFLKLDSFRFESTFGAWLRRIVINKCINALKARRMNFDLYDEMRPLEKNAISEPETDDDDFQLNVAKIHKAIEQLPDGFRTVFTLYMFEGYDHSEIAEILEITESTSKSQFSRARQKIKEMIVEI